MSDDLGIFREEDFDEQGRLKAYHAQALPPDWISLRLCPPHASIKLRPFETCPACLRVHRDELVNVLVGICATTGWHLDPDDTFSEQGLADLNRNLETAKNLIGEAHMENHLEARLRSTITTAVLGLEKSYGTCSRVLEAMKGDIERRLAGEL